MKHIPTNSCVTFLTLVFVFFMLGCSSSNNDEIEELENVMGDSNRSTFETQPIDYGDYVIQIEDEISIQILARSDRSPLLSVTSLSVDHRGMIFLPIVGELKVVGLTQSELREKLAEAYSSEFRSPEIIASIPSPRGMKIFVLGEVKKPGVYNLGFTTSALEGVLIAGGFSKDAEKSLVVLLRPPSVGMEESATKIGVVDFEKMLTKADIRQNVNLKPGDVLYVPPDNIAHGNRLYKHLNDMVAPFASFIGSVGSVVVLRNSF